jgi:hypothetical protein
MSPNSFHTHEYADFHIRMRMLAGSYVNFSLVPRFTMRGDLPWPFPFVVLSFSTYSFTVSVEDFLFSLHTQTHTAVCRTPLDEGSARRRDLYLTTQTLYVQETNIHAPARIWNHDSSKRSAPDLRLRQCGHWDRPLTPPLQQYNAVWVCVSLDVIVILVDVYRLRGVKKCVHNFI